MVMVDISIIDGEELGLTLVTGKQRRNQLLLLKIMQLLMVMEKHCEISQRVLNTNDLMVYPYILNTKDLIVISEKQREHKTKFYTLILNQTGTLPLVKPYPLSLIPSLTQTMRLSSPGDLQILGSGRRRNFPLT